MATATTTSGTVVFSNSGAAANLTLTRNEGGSLLFDFDVLATSGGGTNTTIYSVDEGTKNDDGGATIVVTNKAFADYNKDLLIQDAATAGVVGYETSLKGAKFWIGTDGKIHYDASALAGQIDALGAGQSFTDTIQYTIKMSNGTLSVGTLTVVINGQNDAPTSTNDSVTTNEDTPKILSLSDFGNYSDIEGSPLAAVKITSLATDGTLQYNNGSSWVAVTLNQVVSAADITTGKLRFAPDANENGANYATIGFKVSDGTDFSTSAYTLTVNVTAVNDAPTSTNDSVTTNEDTPKILSLGDFGNYSDTEGSALAAVKITSLATDGTLQCHNGVSWVAVTLDQVVSAADITAGKLRYFVPDANENGANYATIGFKVSDGTDFSASAYTLTVNVTTVNDAPTTAAVTLAAVAEDSGARIITQAELLSQASDIEGDDLVASNLHITSGSGTLDDNLDGTWTYTPADDDDTSVSFGYTITDNGTTNGAADPKSVAGSATLDITTVNDAPTTAAVTLAAVAEDSGARIITQAELLSQASDIEGDDLVASNLHITSGSGTLDDNLDGTWTYTPADDDDTSVSFGYTITDNGTTNGAADPKSVAGSATLDITTVNDAPTTAAVTLAAVAEDSGARIITQAELLSQASDIEGDDLVASNLHITSGSGTLDDNLDGTWTYTPADDDDTSVSFGYTITDNGTTNGAADPKSVAGSATLDITAVNDAPLLNLTTMFSHNVQDQFNSAAYNLNSGDVNWSGNWTESESTSATAGAIQVLDDPSPGTNLTLRLGDNSNAETSDVTITRSANLSGATAATLSFNYNKISADSGEDLIVNAWNGAAFVEIGRVLGSSADGTGTFNVALAPNYISANTQIQLVAATILDNNEFYYVDNVNIAYTNHPQYTFGRPAVVLDGIATLSDIELDAANNYNGATLTLARQGGASAQDVFSGSGLLSLSASNVVYNGTTVGSFTQAGGTFTITFNGNATSSLVDNVLQNIAYSNTSNTSTSVQLAITFNDGNSGTQGSGGALSSAGSITVDIIADNTPPTVVVTQTNTGGTTGSGTFTFTFSEAVSGFEQADISYGSRISAHGVLNHVGINGSGQDVWTQTFTYSASGTRSATVANNSYADLAGNLGAGGTTGSFPAGVAGEQINLALTGPSSDQIGPVTLIIAGVPSGWTLSDGIDNGDGTWTVQTNNIAALAITSPIDYAGALVLQVAMSWTNVDGTTGTAYVADNVEVFAPGNPIFAWSGDDHLTGSTGADQFVFSQPIGHDVIHSFDASQDRIDLIGYHGDNGGAALTYADIQARLSEDSAGNAVITLADGQSITLDGVHAADLSEANFEFDLTPVTNNAGTMTISDGAMLPLSGIINNTGTIGLNSEGSGTLLQLIQYGITLQGDGQIVLSDDAGNVITGTLSGVNLINVDNTISGAGQLGAGQLDLDNAGDIIATGTHALVIDTGSNVIENTGTLEATGSGGLVIDSDLDNSGLVWAHGANVSLNGAVTGSGTVLLDGIAAVEFGSNASVDTSLAADAIANLVLRDSFDFSGTISGFDGNDTLDLVDIAFNAGVTLDFTANQDGTGGVLHVTDGTHTANIALLGQYDASAFSSDDDGFGGTAIAYDRLHSS